MPLIEPVQAFIRNYWAQEPNLEVHRSDLFVVDLREVIKHLSQMGVKELPAEEQSFFYAYSVNFPEVKTNTETFLKDNQQVQMPAYDAPVEATKIAFHLDSPATLYRSRAYTLLNQWRQLHRSGRGYFTGDQPSPLEGSVGTSQSGSVNEAGKRYLPKYRFTVRVYLLRGSSDLRDPSFVSPVAQPSRAGMAVSNVWVMERCWVSGIQLSELSHASVNTLTSVTASIYAEAIYALSEINSTSGQAASAIQSIR